MDRNHTIVLYMLVGIPGSGKSTWAGNLDKEVRIHSSDALRKELFGDERIQGNPSKLFAELNKRLITDLKKGYSCVYDATNMNRKRRMNLLSMVPTKVKKVCVLFLTAPSVCVERDQRRKRRVGEAVIDRMLRSFQLPGLYEGFDEILPVLDSASYKLPMEQMRDFSQDNPHHTLTLGEHMESAQRYCRAEGFREEVCIAAGYHDVGKLFTKRFENYKGEKTEIAHFFGHENYGAYLFLLDAYLGEEEGRIRWKYKDFESSLYIAQIINWHMRPYEAWKDESIPRESDVLLLGSQMTRDILCMHKADAQAH